MLAEIRRRGVTSECRSTANREAHQGAESNSHSKTSNNNLRTLKSGKSGYPVQELGEYMWEMGRLD